MNTADVSKLFFMKFLKVICRMWYVVDRYNIEKYACHVFFYSSRFKENNSSCRRRMHYQHSIVFEQ